MKAKLGKNFKNLKKGEKSLWIESPMIKYSLKIKL